MIEILRNQILSAMATLKQCIDNCPDDMWDASDYDYPFCQVLFHTLFCTDRYLSKNHNDFLNQPFHLENKNIFKDYEDLKVIGFREKKNFNTKEEIISYYNFCYNKIVNYEEANLLSKSVYCFEDMTIFEKIISSVIRHIQHHAAQLGLRIQQKTKKELEWVE